MSKVTSAKRVTTQFSDVRAWFNQNMGLDNIDLGDQRVYKHVYHEGRFPGIFQCTSGGAQRLFKKAKPTSIIDIAALTSIYRPGPLAANVDKLWLEHADMPYDWGHPLINETLKETRGLLVFQEGVMALVNKVSGFPMAETDEVRRAIMKRSISGGDAAKQKMKDLEEGIVMGAVKNGVPEATARKMYETITFMAGYGFNKSHAIAYAIDSYWCAWLLTHHEEEWLCAYLESMSNSPENKAEALGYVKAMGYQTVPIDINHALPGWTALPGKRFMPSFLSCKGIGGSAVAEIMANRPYKSVEDMLWNDDGTWRHSKLNKKAMDALIKIGAFASLDAVGPGRLFGSWHHMHEVVVENQDLIKKTSKKDPHLGRKAFFELARGLAPVTDEWTRKELAAFNVELFGSLDVTKLLEPAVLQRLEDKGIKSIDAWTSKDLYWFCVVGSTAKKTKAGKHYLQLNVVGPVGKPTRLNVWGWDGVKQFDEYALCVAEVDKNDFGASTTMWRLKAL